ncbi:hypothetical protein Clacol_008104 [Clathrus columnatus]|uniref:Uncharacterized protein n=1 Tax=Clathrus columnatus TaxID=1419009 RepID=A0AAV5AGS8_9AGAM|nr:hypothetical protein Clacol_008104 [Clathrus columnatus]
MAAARAAARRQAILNARGDRLAKLTSSARGEDPGGVYAQDIQAAATSNLKNFVGEETILPPPPPSVPVTPEKPATVAEIPSSNTSRATRTPKSVSSAPREQTPEWTPQQQEELMRAFLNADMTNSSQPPLPRLPSALNSDQQSQQQSADDVLAQLFSSLNGSADKLFQHVETAPPPTRTLGQRLIPILHLLSMIGLVIWFSVFREPEQVRLNVESVGVKGIEVESHFGWKRWGRLASMKPDGDMWSVPTLPAFFWAFTTIELALHSLRLISKPVRVSMFFFHCYYDVNMTKLDSISSAIPPRTRAPPYTRAWT